MVITYQGGNYFKIQSGELALLIDPDNQRSYRGTQLIVNTLKPPLAEAPEMGEGQPVWIENAGEYEVRGVRVTGWNAGYSTKEKKTHTVYRILFDEISIVVLGYLTDPLTPEVVSELSDADIVIAPAHGSPLLGHDAVAKLIRQMEPGIVIPSLPKDTKAFLKALGETDVKPEEKLVLKKKDIAPKAMKVHVLSS